MLQLLPNSEYSLDITNDESSRRATLVTNGHGRAARVDVTVVAQGFAQAKSLAYDFVAPMLSFWSFEYDVAIDLLGFDCLEVATGSRDFVFGVLGMVQDFDLTKHHRFDKEADDLLASYREAVNSTNLFYRVLTFYKIADAIRANRRRLNRKHKLLSLPEPALPEVMPSSADDRLLQDQERDRFVPYLGQDFNAVLESFREPVRNAVAHVVPGKAVLSADRLQDLGRCEDLLPPLRFVARTMLRNHLTELDFVRTLTRSAAPTAPN